MSKDWKLRIRIGASDWDITARNGDKEVTVDLSTLTRDERFTVRDQIISTLRAGLAPPPRRRKGKRNNRRKYHVAKAA
jgi:hypothetical protein